jgi:hypothetical protein
VLSLFPSEIVGEYVQRQRAVLAML